MEPVTMAALLFGGALLLGGKKRSRSRGTMSLRVDQERSHAQRMQMLNQIRSMANWSSQKWGMMPFLADYLTAVAYWETRFNETKVNPEYYKSKAGRKNAARGLFQMRPNSAFRDSNNLLPLLSKPNLLLDPRWAFVTALDYIAQGDKRSWEKSGRESNWLAIRRWWRRPALLHDYGEQQDEAKSVHRKLVDAIEGVNREYGQNIDEDFIYMPVQVGGYPGIWTTMPAFGLDPRRV